MHFNKFYPFLPGLQLLPYPLTLPHFLPNFMCYSLNPLNPVSTAHKFMGVTTSSVGRAASLGWIPEEGQKPPPAPIHSYPLSWGGFRTPPTPLWGLSALFLWRCCACSSSAVKSCHVWQILFHCRCPPSLSLTLLLLLLWTPVLEERLWNSCLTKLPTDISVKKEAKQTPT